MYVRGVSRLEGTEEKFRNRESRPEDLQVIAELREMVSEREALVKKLVVSMYSNGPQRCITTLKVKCVLLYFLICFLFCFVLSQNIRCLQTKVNISSLIFLHRAFRSDCASFVPG